LPFMDITDLQKNNLADMSMNTKMGVSNG
jgi:hypothetical protein